MKKYIKFQQIDKTADFLTLKADEPFIKSAAVNFIKAAAKEIGMEPISLIAYLIGVFFSEAFSDLGESLSEAFSDLGESLSEHLSDSGNSSFTDGGE